MFRNLFLRTTRPVRRPSPRQLGRPASYRPHIEGLESRLIPSCSQPTISAGVLTVNCDNNGNDITLYHGGSVELPETYIQAPNYNQFYYDTQFSSIQVNSGDGNDTISIPSLRKPLTINGGAGVDTVNVGESQDGLASVWQPVTVMNTPGRGSTSLNLDDTGDPQARSVTLSDTAVTGLAGAPISYRPGDLRYLNVISSRAGTAYTITNTPTGVSGMLTEINANPLDSFTVRATSGALKIDIPASGNPALAQHINLGDSGSVQNIHGNVTVSFLYNSFPNRPRNTVTVDDSADNASGTVTVSAGNNGETISGFARGTITIDGANTNLDVTIRGGRAYRDFLILDTDHDPNETTTLYTGSATDGVRLWGGLTSPLTVNVQGANTSVGVSGGAASERLDTLQAALTVNFPVPGSLGLNDSGGLGGGTGSYSYVVTATSVSRSGLSAPIRYSGSPSLELLPRAGSANDTVAVQSTAGATTIKQEGPFGTNAVTIGSTSNTLDAIRGQLDIEVAPSGSAAVTVNDQGTTAAATYTVTDHSIARTGLPGTITYQNLATLTLNGGAGNNDYAVQSTAAGTSVNLDTGAGRSRVVVGSSAPALTVGTLADIAGSTQISSTGGEFSLYLVDHSRTTPGSAALVQSELDGLSPAPIHWQPSQTSALTVIGGQGGNTSSRSTRSWRSTR